MNAVIYLFIANLVCGGLSKWTINNFLLLPIALRMIHENRLIKNRKKL